MSTKKTAARKNTRQYYYAHYVRGCSPCLKKFKTKKELNTFLNSFDPHNEDDWIDFTFKGSDLKIISDYDFKERL